VRGAADARLHSKGPRLCTQARDQGPTLRDEPIALHRLDCASPRPRNLVALLLSCRIMSYVRVWVALRACVYKACHGGCAWGNVGGWGPRTRSGGVTCACGAHVPCGIFIMKQYSKLTSKSEEECRVNLLSRVNLELRISFRCRGLRRRFAYPKGAPSSRVLFEDANQIVLAKIRP